MFFKDFNVLNDFRVWLCPFSFLDELLGNFGFFKFFRFLKFLEISVVLKKEEVDEL